MPKDQREILTKESIKKEFFKKDKTENIILAIFIPVVVILFVMLILLINTRASYMWLFGLFAILFDLVLVVGVICGIYVTVKQSQIIKNGDFSIIEDELIDIKEDVIDVPEFLFNTSSYNSALKDVFYFAKFGKVKIKREMCGRDPFAYKRMRNYSSRGDIFYILVYNNKKNKVRRIYNSKLYRWEGDN